MAYTSCIFIQTRDPAIAPPHLPSNNSVLKIINIRGDICLKLKTNQFTCVNIIINSYLLQRKTKGAYIIKNQMQILTYTIKVDLPKFFHTMPKFIFQKSLTRKKIIVQTD